MYTIGYVDENPTEVKTIARNLRKDFNVITYDIPKGLQKQDLIDQIYQTEIDLLLVDFKMRDRNHLTYNGDEVVRAFEALRPNFPMIIFTNNENDAFPAVDDVNIIYDKKVMREERPHFLEFINKNIKNYHRYIQVRKERIAELLHQRAERELNVREKDELFTLQLDLNRLDPRGLEANPNQLLSDMNLDRLNQVTKDAEALLKSLTDDPI